MAEYARRHPSHRRVRRDRGNIRQSLRKARQSFEAAAPPSRNRVPRGGCSGCWAMSSSLGRFRARARSRTCEVGADASPVRPVRTGGPCPEASRSPRSPPGGIERIAPVPIYAADPLVRRSKPLQATKDGEFAGVGLSPENPAPYGIRRGRAGSGAPGRRVGCTRRRCRQPPPRRVRLPARRNRRNGGARRECRGPGSRPAVVLRAASERAFNPKAMPEPLATALGWLPHELALLVEALIKVVALLVPLLVTVAWFTYAERKVIGYMQVRLGPNRVGPKGLLQPVADAVKLMFKEFPRPRRGEPAPVRGRARDLARHRAGGVGGDPVLRLPGRRRHQRRAALHPRDDLARGVRSHHRGMVVELEVRPARRDALRRPDRGLRDRDGLRARGGADGGGEPQPARDRAGAGRADGSTGSGCRCCRCSWCTSSPAWPRPTGRRSTWPRASPRSWPASTSSTRGWRSRCSSWPSTRTWSSSAR